MYTLNEQPFIPHELEIILYAGMVVLEIMKQSPDGLQEVQIETIEAAEEGSSELFEQLSQLGLDAETTTRTLLLSHPEPEVLRYILDVVMDVELYDEEDPPIREEYRALAFFHLKVLLDALIASRKPPTITVH